MTWTITHAWHYVFLTSPRSSMCFGHATRGPPLSWREIMNCGQTTTYLVVDRLDWCLPDTTADLGCRIAGGVAVTVPRRRRESLGLN